MNDDITSDSILQNLRAENALLLQENERLKQLASWVDFVTDAVATAEPQSFRLQSWNKAAEQLYGVSSSEALGKTIPEVTQRSYVGISRTEVIGQLRANGHWEGEVREFKRDGTPLIVLTSVSAIKNRAGEIQYYLAINRDITAISKIEASIERQRRSFQVIAEAAAYSGSMEELCCRVLNDLIRTLRFDIGSIRLLDKDQRTLRAVAVYGIESDKLEQLTPPQDIDDSYYFAPWVARNRTAFFAPDAFNHPVSKTHGARLKELGIRALISWPIIDSDNQLLGVLQLTSREARDINIEDRSFFTTVTSLFASLLRRKQTEEALRISEENYRSIFNNIQDAFFRVGLDGRLQMLNPSGLRLLGYESPDEVIGTLVAETVYYNSSDRLKYIELLNRDGYLKDMDIPLRRKDGSRILMEINAYFRHDATGNRIAMEGILRDVRQRKKLEQELLKAQKLESIGLLAGGIAHDFNNILTAIMGNISLARNLLPPDSRACSRLSKAEDACLRARDINQQLLTFSKGGKPLRQLTDVGRLLHETAGFSLRGSNIKCKISIPEELWPAEIDEGQISQAIHNLIINAVQAMPGGGILNIAARNTEPESTGGDGKNPEILIHVEDSGIGMDADTVAKAFDPYFSTKPEGTGLGLTTVFSIIKNHEGRISIQSEPGRGTTVTIQLPAQSGRLVEAKPGKISLSPVSGRLLIMDDEQTILEMARALCGEIHMELIEATEGVSAIESYTNALHSNQPIDLVIIDLTIPGGMGGAETIKRLRIIDPDVRAIVSSGYSDDPVMANFRDHGFIACLKKPYQVDDLYRTITGYLHYPAMVPNPTSDID